MAKKLMIYALAFFLLCAIASSIYFWYEGNHRPVVSKTEYVKVPEIRTVEKVRTVEIPVEKIVIREKEGVTKYVTLPSEIKDDPAKQITTTATVEPYEGKTNVVSIIDTQTGVSDILLKQDPLPFIALENRRELGFRSGYNSDSRLESTLYGRWTVLRIGNAHLGAYGEANTEGRGKAQLELSYRW
ncbi:MAG: hypothetical protein PHQ43_13415 [Dehalococcoidales bacterium]|jgi:hypothetical protein|nr:hypothetical protein [Dehalococcoidales bacterium]